MNEIYVLDSHIYTIDNCSQQLLSVFIEMHMAYVYKTNGVYKKNICTRLKFHLSKPVMPEPSERSDSCTWAHQYYWCFSFRWHIKVRRA